MEQEKKVKLYIADSEDEGLVDYFSQKEEYEVVGQSSDGNKTYIEVRELKPDFLIMEVMLSGIDGFKVLENLKADLKDEMPKVIFISHLSHSGFVSKAIKEGASYFMVKPIMPENLQERIEDVMKEKKDGDAVNQADRQLD